MILINQSKIMLTNERIILREFNKTDWVDVHKYASQETVCQYQAWGPNSVEESRSFVNQIIQDASQSPRIRFALAVIFNGNMVGSGELNIRDTINKIGEVSYIVNPDYWGKGLATDMGDLLIDFGFKELELHRIYATSDPRNIGSLKVLEKIGMAKEGKLRENLLIKGGYRNSFLYSVLEHEWKK